MPCKLFLPLLLAAGLAQAAEFHVAVTGDNANPGTADKPLKTIQAAANLAQPGDTVTVHAGVYRERIDPPRGGTDDAHRITYQAAPGEKVTITGAEIVKGWEKVQNDTWKVALPARFFGTYNPYGELVRGDYFISEGRPNHTGAVYLDGSWLAEAYELNRVLAPAAGPGCWFAAAPGKSGKYLMNLAWFSPGADSARVRAASAVSLNNLQRCDSVEGQGCLGFIQDGSWASFKEVSLAGVKTLRFRVAVDGDVGVSGSQVEIHLDSLQGPLLGTCRVRATGGWQQWETVEADILPADGVHTIVLLFKDRPVDPEATTTLWAQFPGCDPNAQTVEINVRPTVFTPSRSGIDYITVRGFSLRQAATNWAPPTAGQIGVVSAYWNKGWIIEGNEVSYSICAGIALGKYGDANDNACGNNSQSYVNTIDQALANGWNKERIGRHVVRNNHIHHCEQVGIVGSMGSAFSRVEGNDIHDIHVRKVFGGWEQAGIKFHGAIDTVIANNHIYNNGSFGIWLDWMCQGAQVTGNLFHHNQQDDLFCEMQHGPLLIANNLFVSQGNSLFVNSKGLAFTHNLITGGTRAHPYDERRTPFHKPHSTEIVGLYDAPGGDHRFFNNLFTTRSNAAIFDASRLPCFAAGNVFTKGSSISKFDAEALVLPNYDPAPRLVQKNGEWWLSISIDQSWRGQKRALVTTGLLGKAKIPDLPYENPDGSPITLDTDYFGQKRDPANPFPGPFETPVTGEVKVWPK